MEYNTRLLDLLGNNPQSYVVIWNEWKQINPDTRIVSTQYPEVEIAHPIPFTAHSPVKVPRDGLKALVWRMLGRWAKRPAWKLRGMRDEWGMVPIPLNTKTIRLKRFEWQSIDGPRHIYLGYHAPNDTLLVGAWNRSGASAPEE